MFNVFNKENVKEVVNKKPLICFYSENGACGPSGLFIVVFEDNSSYGYSTFYKNSDENIIVDIIKNIPEVKGFLPSKLKDKCFNRKSYINEMDEFYLGMGNSAIIHKSLLNNVLNLDFKSCINLIEKISEVPPKEMLGEVNSILNI